MSLIVASGVCGCVMNPAPEVRFVVLGDSITGTLETDTYPRLLVQELDIEEAEFAAEGRGGRTTATGLLRLAEIIEFESYPNAEVFIQFLGAAEIIDFILAHDPGLAVSPSESEYPFTEELDGLLALIASNMRSILNLASAQGWEVLVTTYYDLPADKTPCEAFGDNPLDEIEAQRANEYIDLLNEVILELAAELGIAVVDVRAESANLVENLDNFEDCIHPSESGARIIAQRFADVLD